MEILENAGQSGNKLMGSLKSIINDAEKVLENSTHQGSETYQNAKKKLDNAKSAPETLNNPKTGDNGKLWMWFALLFVSGGGLLGTTAYRRKRKETEN